MSPDTRASTSAGLESRARRELGESLGHSDADVVTAWAPGRCTLVGEHVDYVAGFVVCVAINLGVAVALRPAADGMYRAVSGDQRVARRDPTAAGDVGDRVFAPAVALRRFGVDAPPYEAALVADVPAGAGLASSAAVICAVITALLRNGRVRLKAHEVVATALTAERDIVGVPCGALDQHAVVEAPEHGALLLDCKTDSSIALPWPWDDLVLCACNTGEQHDVAGTAYRDRREQAEGVLRRLGVASAQDITGAMLSAAALPGVEERRARHIATETTRARQAADALRDGDAAQLGRLMTESHASLRDDLDVSTVTLDATVAAALQVRGCFGARMVGAGFGGTAVALVERGGASECLHVMAAAAGTDACDASVLEPSPGLALLAADVIDSR